MENTIIVGRARGPGQKTFEFQFITSDKDKVKIGEFIYYVYKDERGTERKVLSRVINRTPLRLYPDVMLSNPNLDPAIIASTIDYNESEEMDFYLIDAQVIGYYKDDTFKFVNPRMPPKPGQPIFLANASDLTQWLNSVQLNEPKSAFIGHLISRATEVVPIYLNINELVSTHMAVLAATGSGKSYCVGVILEEMMSPRNKAAVLVIDPHGEYTTLSEIEALKEYQTQNYKPNVKIFNPDEIQIKLSSMRFEELSHLLKGLTDKMENYLRNAFYKVKKISPASFTIQDILNELDSYSNADPKIETTIAGIKWRLDEYVKNKSIISDSKHKSLRELLMPGQLSVMNFSSLTEEDQQLTLSVLLNRILESRILATRGKMMGVDPSQLDPDKNKELLDYPVFIVLEEGHKFAPANNESWSKKILKTILSEGRKFGIGVCVVSQRPGKLDSDVLSQCMSQIIMKIKNPVDQKNIRDSIESVSEDLINELPGLTKGQALISGEAINTPVLINIRKRLTTHGGQSHDAVKSWTEYRIEQKAKRVPDSSREKLI